jgi:hypothetical protein
MRSFLFKGQRSNYNQKINLGSRHFAVVAGRLSVLYVCSSSSFHFSLFSSSITGRSLTWERIETWVYDQRMCEISRSRDHGSFLSLTSNQPFSCVSLYHCIIVVNNNQKSTESGAKLKKNQEKYFSLFSWFSDCNPMINNARVLYFLYF